jgi:hypothetical protein
MKSYIIFSSREPFLIVTRGTIRDKGVVDHLGRIGCSKFISREVPIEHIRRQYGRRFEVTEKALRDGGDLRVLDYSGERVFQNLPFSEFGGAYRCESASAPA